MPDLFKKVFDVEQAEKDFQNFLNIILLECVQKGKRKHALQTAKNMLADNCPIETICKYSGLTPGEVRKLASNSKKGNGKANGKGGPKA